MKCFYHPEVDAIGTCKKCGKSLCKDCSVEIGTDLYCKARLEEVKTNAVDKEHATLDQEAPLGHRGGALSDWFESWSNPANVFRREKKNASLGNAITNVGVAGLAVGVVYAVIFGLILLLFAGMMSAFEEIYGIDMGAFALILIVAIIIFVPIFTIIGFLINSGVLFIFAKIFGGKGDFKTQAYLLSLPYAALILIQLALNILGMIPFIGLLFSLVSLLVGIYYLYPLTMALKESHDYTIVSAVLTWFVPLTIIIMLFAVLFISLLANASDIL